MNFLKGIFGGGKKDKPDEKFEDYIGEGRLFLIQQKVKKCIFIFSRVTFIQGKKDPYERYVYVKNLSKESEFHTDEYFFLINESMKLRSYSRKDDEDEIVGFEWNLDNDAVVCCEFGTHINDDLSTAVGFKHHICRLIHESKFRQPATEAAIEEIESFCRNKADFDKEEEMNRSAVSSELMQPQIKVKSKYPDLGPVPTTGPSSGVTQPIVKDGTLEWNKPRVPETKNDKNGIDDLIKDFEKKVDINKDRAEEVKSTTVEQKPRTIGNAQNLTRTNGKSLLAIKTSLSELNENGQAVLLVPKVELFIVDATNFQYYLELFDESTKAILYKRIIDTDLNYHIDDAQSSFRWVEIKADSGDIVVYACKLTKESINSLKTVIAECLFETTTHEYIEDAFKKEEERQYARRWFENDLETVEEYKSEQDDEMEIEDNYYAAHDKPGVQNTGQAQAKVLDRAFISQGPTISVYMTNEDEDGLEHIVSLPPVKAFNGSEILPKKMMMHEQDSKILLLNDPDDTKVYYMDIAKGKIVNEFEGDGVNRFTDIAPTSKHSGFTPNPCFITSNPRNLFLIDPRVSGKNKCVAEKIYATTPKFSCIATNDIENSFATGSEKGEIRLYKEVGQNAKTLFPALGDAITGLDSTSDGSWLLATTKTYLMLIKTNLDGKSGYKQSLAKERKVPIKLTILPEDMMRYKITEINFHSAKFNDTERESEKYIIASTGEFLVTWSMKHVVRGQKDKYEIKRINDYVVSNEFRYKKEDNLLVTLPKEVRIQKTRFY